MQHYLITRFAVPRRNARTLPFLEPEWIEYRLKLMRRFLIPSLAGQECQSFEWLVLSYDRSPMREQLEDAIRRVPGSRVVLYSDGDKYHERMREAIRETLSHPMVMTTRIDSDDAISRRFVRVCQMHARGVEETRAFNFLNGVRWWRGRLLRWSATSNPFVSLLEPSSELDTVYRYSHLEVAKRYPIRQIGGSVPDCMIVCHGDNVANRVNYESSELSKGFPEWLASQWFELDLSVELPASAWKQQKRSVV